MQIDVTNSIKFEKLKDTNSVYLTVQIEDIKLSSEVPIETLKKALKQVEDEN